MADFVRIVLVVQEVTDEMVEQIHQATGGNFRSVDMIIPRILELEQRNRQRLADGAIRMDEIIKVAAARLMICVPSVARREILASLGLSLPPVSKFFHRRQ